MKKPAVYPWWKNLRFIPHSSTISMVNKPLICAMKCIGCWIHLKLSQSLWTSFLRQEKWFKVFQHHPYQYAGTSFQGFLLAVTSFHDFLEEEIHTFEFEPCSGWPKKSRGTSDKMWVSSDATVRVYIYIYYDDISASHLTMLYASLIATSFEQWIVVFIVTPQAKHNVG